MEKCKDWQSRLPHCHLNFGPIYKLEDDKQKILYTFPAIEKYTSQPLTTLTALTIDENRSDATSDEITTEIPVKRSMILYPTPNTFGLDDVTSDIPVKRSMVRNSVTNAFGLEQLVATSVGVGTLSFFIGMAIMYLMFRGHEARRTILQAREVQGENILLLPVQENKGGTNEEHTQKMNQPEEKEVTTTLFERCYLPGDLDGEHVRKSYGISNGQSLL